MHLRGCQETNLADVCSSHEVVGIIDSYYDLQIQDTA